MCSRARRRARFRRVPEGSGGLRKALRGFGADATSRFRSVPEASAKVLGSFGADATSRFRRVRCVLVHVAGQGAGGFRKVLRGSGADATSRFRRVTEGSGRF